jgi:hypothetical protein
MVQAALKAIPLGQNAGQRVLARLLDAIPAAVDHAISLDCGIPPGLPADAGDPVGAARVAVLAALPIVSGPRRPSGAFIPCMPCARQPPSR